MHRRSPDQADRPHQLTVGAYDESGRGTFVDVLLDRESVGVDLALGKVVVPDAKDDTWAKIRLDETSLANLAEVYPRIEDGTTRAVIWNSIRDATADGELGPDRALDLLLKTLPHEDSDIAVGSLLSWVETRLLGIYLPCSQHRGRVAEVLTVRLAQTPPGSSLQLAIAHGVIATTEDAKLLQAWLAGTLVPQGVQIDADLRWSLVLRLAQLGVFGAAEIDLELARDRSTAGVTHAASCRAALRDGKDQAWARIMTDPKIGLNELVATCRGFWHPAQTDVTAPYVERFFGDISGTADLRAGTAVTLTGMLSFPRFAVDQRVIDQAQRLIADDSVAHSIRRAVSDHRDDLCRAVVARDLTA